MSIDESMKRFEKVNSVISLWFEHIAIVAVLGMILVTLIDVIGAKVFRWPMPAGIEAVYLLQIIAIAGALAISKIDGRHVRIEMIDKLRQPALGIIHAVVALVGLLLFILLTWQSTNYALSLLRNHEVTATARLPYYPFAMWLGLCCVPMVLILVKEFVASLIETRGK